MVEQFSLADALREIDKPINASPRTPEWDAEFERQEAIEKEAIPKLVGMLRPLLPQLHSHLKERHGAELSEWIKHGPFKCAIDFDPSGSTFYAQWFLEHLFEDDVSVRIAGYDGWQFGEMGDILTDADAGELQKAAAAFFAALPLDKVRDRAVTRFINQVLVEKLYKDDALHDAAFAVYGIADVSDVPENLRLLFLFEAGVLEEFEWMVISDEELQVYECWYGMRDTLPPEVVALINAQISRV